MSARIRRFKLTQIGNAERFAHLYGDDVRYCPAWKKWLRWNGHGWGLDGKCEVERLAKQTVRSISDEAKTVKSDLREKYAAFAHKSESMYSVDAILRLARSSGAIPVEPEELDR